MFKPQNLSVCRIYCGLILLICLCLLTGCPDKKKNRPQYGTEGSAGGQTNDDVFRQSLDMINQLENHYGREMLNQAMGRLDNWVAGMPKDETWKPSSFYVETEKRLNEIHTEMVTFQTLLRKIARFSEDDPADAVPEDIQAAADKAGQIVELFAKSYAPLGIQQFMEIVALFMDYRQNLSNFANVAKQQNLSAAKINDFVKKLLIRQTPLPQSLEQLNHYTLAMEIFAEAFRGDSLSFRGIDGDYIKQALWCRNVSQWARGKSQLDLERAKELFDWTIRNIVLKSRFDLPDGSFIPTMPQPAWQAMLYGQGTLSDWCSVFIALLRQQRIDACVLGIIGESQGFPRQLPWGVGVLIDGELYVFFAELGMPLTQENGYELKEGEGLVFTKIATLSQLKNNPSLLTFSSKNSIPLESAEKLVENTRIFLPVDPIAHSMRMKIIENELKGTDKLVLHNSPSEFRERIKKAAPDVDMAVWHYDFEGLFENCLIEKETASIHGTQHVLQDAAFQLSIRQLSDKQLSIRKHSNPLWKGRLLYFANKISGEDGAANCLQEARVTDREMSELPSMDQLQYAVCRFATVTAGYWLGTLAYNSYSNEEFGQKDSNAVRNYFQKQVLQNPVGAFWRNGATYHLARAAEREGKYEEAIQYYSVETQEVDFSGRLLRASLIAKLAGISFGQENQNDAQNSDQNSDSEKTEEKIEPPSISEQPPLEPIGT
ncbi:MAG: hypothetical protein LBQ54_16510 [Planctomycetaceae bacterium]|jgi:hypothetical protein|nr:hypothetical protein [Planctomycetaceae bacterium]